MPDQVAKQKFKFMSTIVERVTKKCENCHHEYSKLPCQLKAKISLCSRKCYWEYKKGKPVTHLLEKDGKFKKEIADKISKALTGIPQPHNINEKHHEWKGDKASYFAFHMWLIRKYGKANKCESLDCVYPRKNANGKILLKPNRYEWSLVHGQEHGHYRDRYWMLCASCHRKYDKN